MAIDINALLRYWKERIEKDLTPFIDPGTTLRLETRGRVVQAEWKQRGKMLDAAFNISIESGAQVSFRASVLDYKSFYASPEMADLMSLAKMILQARPQQLYVDTKAKRFDVESPQPTPAIAMLHEVLSSARSSDEATLVLIVTGEAGAGKTSVLQQFVRQRSDDYLRGKTESLLLYINAQGRALARFNEALATELQDLRAILTYHAVSTLVRLGLIVPIIDGFDELLGVGGYEDAFSSLASFIEELDGQGQLIASARSTYYEQEFVDRANRVSGLGAQVWRQIPIEVLAWGDEEFGDYLNQRCTLANRYDSEAVALKDKVAAVFKGRNESLKAKPLFIARTVDLLLSGAELRGTDDLLEELVNAYIERERTEKLLDRSGGHLLTSDQILSLLISLSEEMWNQETRELDKRSAKEVAEYVLVTNEVAEVTQRVVIERLPSMAFLSIGQKPGSVTFEHETFFSFFLAQRFHSIISETESPPSLLLGRSVLPEDVAHITVNLIKRNKSISQPIQAILNRLGAAGSVQASRMAQVRENSGLLTEVLLKELSAEHAFAGLRLWNVVFPGGDLHNVTINGGIFDNVEFRRVDLTRTRFLNCTARSIEFYDILVDPAYSRLEIEGLDPISNLVGLRRVDISGVHSLYDPQEVQQTLEQIGAAKPLPRSTNVYRSVGKVQLEVLKRFIRAYNRSNPVCTADDNMTFVFKHQSWPKIQRLLVESRVVTEEVRGTGGPSKLFLRRQVAADQIMAGARKDAHVPEPVKRFWDAFEREFPGKT